LSRAIGPTPSGWPVHRSCRGCLQSGGRALRVRFGDRHVEPGVLRVGVVVVGRFLSGRVRRVAEDHADVERPLLCRPLVIHWEHVPDAGAVARLAELEGVSEHDAGERLVTGVGAADAGTFLAVGGLDVHGGDVVREEQDLVGVQLLGELAVEVVGANEAGLQQAGHEGAGTRERVEDMDALVGQAGAVEALLMSLTWDIPRPSGPGRPTTFPGT
jgi:hypothetical protein